MNKFMKLVAVRGCMLLFLSSIGGMVHANDPWEKFNRGVFGFNDWVDLHMLRPVAKTYKNHMPKFVQAGVSNVFDNIETPAVAVNQLLQGKPKQAASDVARFFVNSTLGVGGLFDVATHTGLEKHSEDFGQTFATWGVGSGNYVVLPALGSANVRDSVGHVLDYVINPLRLISPVETRWAVAGVNVIDVRSDLLAVESLVLGDKYIFFRESYQQRRQFLVNDGMIDDDPFASDGFGDEFDDFDE